ncbi:MAG: hypothetical protein KDK38_15850, partial [Leptospiraceae bacterium]|nr:hypothetical protein [Leptospiraceae bacterium]
MYESAAREDELEKQRQREKDWQEWNELDEDCKREVLEFLNRDNDHQYNYKNHKNDRRPEQHHGPGMNQTSVCLGKSKLQFTFCESISGEEFSCEISYSPLLLLLKEASQGYRLYELFQITRPGDLHFYLRVIWREFPDQEYSGFSSLDNASTRDEISLLMCEDLLAVTHSDTDEMLSAQYFWYLLKNSDEFKIFVEKLYSHAIEIQEQLLASSEPIIRYELELMATSRHDLDHATDYRVLTKHSYISPVTYNQELDEKFGNSEGFYRIVKQFLADSKFKSVAILGQGTYRLFRLLCNQRLSRNTPQDLEIHASVTEE